MYDLTFTNRVLLFDKKKAQNIFYMKTSEDVITAKSNNNLFNTFIMHLSELSMLLSDIHYKTVYIII